MPASPYTCESPKLLKLGGIAAFGLGSVAGPLIGAALMAQFTIDGVFYFMAVAALSLAFLAAGRSRTRMAPQHLERPFEILAPQAATLAHAPPARCASSLGCLTRFSSAAALRLCSRSWRLAGNFLLGLVRHRHGAANCLHEAAVRFRLVVLARVSFLLFTEGSSRATLGLEPSRG